MTTTIDTIKLDPTALAKARELYEQYAAQGKPFLRVYIEGKGCAGFYYGVCFDAQDDNDQMLPQDDLINIIIDPDTYFFLKGSVISWVDDERGQGFLVNNPRDKKFRGKFYRKKSFQQQLQQYREQLKQSKGLSDASVS